MKHKKGENLLLGFYIFYANRVTVKIYRKYLRVYCYGSTRLPVSYLSPTTFFLAMKQVVSVGTHNLWNVFLQVLYQHYLIVIMIPKNTHKNKFSRFKTNFHILLSKHLGNSMLKVDSKMMNVY